MRTEEMIGNFQSVPAFLGKLWKMVNDSKTDNLICWGKDGTTFIIRNEIDFLCIMLPMYYKHNKMSSFIRQLNMYGFRKIPILDSKEQDTVEFEFMHPFFRQGHPEMLVNVKRKGSTKYATADKDGKIKKQQNCNTTVDSDNITEEKVNVDDNDNLNVRKILSDIKELRGQYSQVDGVINSLKQENAVLWREIAILRQKQQKQLQIVNKLIQFLMTVVQPSTRRGGGIGVKRRYPLMIHANPDKKQKLFSDGPTIHELDSSDVLTEDMLPDADAQDVGQVQSPSSSRAGHTPQQYDIQNNEIFDPDLLLKDPKNSEITKSEHLVEELLGDSDLNEGIEDSFHFSNEDGNYEDVFLNSSSQDPLLANISDGCYNSNVLNDMYSTNTDLKQEPSTSKMAVAKKCYPQLNSLEDIRKHQDTMDNELDQLKDFLSNCNSIDSKYLLNLFNDTPTYGLSTGQNKDDLVDFDLPSGSQLTRYEPGTIDFNDLRDEANDDEFVQPQYILTSPFNDNTQVDPLEIVDVNEVFPIEK